MISPIVKRYCTDVSKIENYDLAVADKELWHCHHRLELTINGEYAHSKESLERLGMYWHRPAFELIFLKPSDHYALHKVTKINMGPKIAKSKIGVKRPDSVRLKLSEYRKHHPVVLTEDGKARKIEKLKARRGHVSKETRNKISAALKGKPKSEECKQKLSEAKKGKPNFKLRGRKFSAEHLRHMSEARKGMPLTDAQIKAYEKFKGRKLTQEHRKRISESHKMKATSDFGKWFVETYGVSRSEAQKLYDKCRGYWRHHGEFKKFNKEDFV